MRQKTTSLKTVTLAALIGGADGVAAGLMLAPKSGKALRRDFQEKTGTIIGQVEDTTINRAETLRQQSSDLVEKGKILAADIQTFIQDLRSKKQGYIDIAQSVSSEPQQEAQETSEPQPEPAPPVYGPFESPLKDELPK